MITWKYEYIIRDEISYNNISEYIINNPANWKEDDFANYRNDFITTIILL